MSGELSKGELRREMRATRRGIEDVDERSAVIWKRVRAFEVVRSAGRVMVFTSIPGEPDTRPFIEWCAADGKETVVPEDEPEPSWPDVVIVPGLAFTPSGERLGQGGGWYDRFLAGRRDGCVVIGVGYREQLLDAIPSEAHDVILDAVVVDR